MVGRTVLHYRILEKLGQGGMGVVYKAEDTKLKRTVALKFLLPHILSSDEDKARFIHEAQAAAALHHPNICTIYEINEAEDQTFIAMAYVEGESLAERITRGPLEPLEAVRIALQLARGLRAAHDKGIVHRDIKSSNILISPDGRATIMDFGLAKSAHQSHATKRGTQMGTIAYMSPEQTRGDRVDTRTDIWSLGVLMYEMITGRRPFRGDYDEAVIYSILNEDAESARTYAPDAPADIDIAIRRAMAKNTDDRYQTAAELVEDLEVVHDDIRNGSSSSRLRSVRGSSSATVGKAATRSFFGPRVFVIIFLVLAATVGAIKLTGWVSDRLANRDAGAATKMITLLDEEGRQVERAIPRSEFRRSLMVYFLDNETGDEVHGWVGGAVMALLQVDLFQDEFVYVRSSMEETVRQRLQRAGFSSGFDTPWNLKRQIAEDAHTDYLVTGSYTIGEEDLWVINLRLHESRSGRLVESRVHMGKDLFGIIDEAAEQLKRDIGLPESHIEEKTDLPVAEVFTGSLPALKGFCLGIYSALFDQDWPASVGYLESAVAEDSTFSWGYYTLFQLYQAANVRDMADPAMRAALRHSYKLPERMRFLVKAAYYGHVQDPEKQLGVLEMMLELYPDGIEARSLLAYFHQNRNERQMAIEQYEKILEIDPSRSECLQDIANCYREMGNFDRAIEYYEAYRNKYPDDAEAYHDLGVMYEINGGYDEARALYEKALLLDPSNTPVIADLGDIEGKLSNDKRALELFDEALELAATPQDRERIYRSFRSFYSNRGQMKKSLEYVRLVWAEREKYMAPLGVEIEKLFDLCLFVRAGRTQEAFAILDGVKAQLVPPYDELAYIGDLCIYVELSEPDKIEPALAHINNYMDTYDDERCRDDVLWAEGEMKEGRGDYMAAIDCYNRKLEVEPWDLSTHRSIGRCYRKLQRYQDAITALDRMLRVYPGNPSANYEIALVYHEMGDEKRAMAHLQKALDRWKNADPVYKPAQEARETLARWQS